MKNLAKATPTEFMTQTAKMAKCLEKWIEVIDLDGLKKKYMVEPISFPEGMSKEDKIKAYADYKREVSKKALGFALSIIETMFAEHPQETGEILALSCFVEPEEFETYQIRDYMREISDLLTDECVVGFFTSLVQSGLLRISKK